MTFFIETDNLFFVLGYGVLGLMFLIELVGLLIGFSFLNIGDGDTDIAADGLSGALSWFNLDKVPFIIWLSTLIFFFSSCGLAVNYIAESIFGGLLPTFISVPSAIMLGLFVTKFACRLIASLIPKNESYDISVNEFSDYVATVTTGTATQKLAARASFVDKHNTRHSILVKPLPEAEDLKPQQQVVLIELKGNIWLATPLLSSE